MGHALYRVTEVQVVGLYKISVAFDDGNRQTVDLAGILRGEVFGPLRDQKLFAQVQIDPETHTVVWPNGADMDSETLHDWPRYAKDMKRLARKWVAARAPV